MSSIVVTSSPTSSLSERPDVTWAALIRKPYSQGPPCLITIYMSFLHCFPPFILFCLSLYVCLLPLRHPLLSCVLPIKGYTFHFSFVSKAFCSSVYICFCFSPFCFYSSTLHNLEQSYFHSFMYWLSISRHRCGRRSVLLSKLVHMHFALI